MDTWKADKASDETVNKTYAEYKQRELNEKGEKTGKAWGMFMLLIRVLPEFLWWSKSEMLKNYSKILRMIQSLEIRWLT